MLAKRDKMETRKRAAKSNASMCARQILIFLGPLVVIGCLLILSSRPITRGETNGASASGALFDDPPALVLTPQVGDSHTDREVSRLQQQIRSGRNVQLSMIEQL